MQANKNQLVIQLLAYIISYFFVTMLVPIKDIADLGQYYLDYLVYVGGHLGCNDNIMVN